MSAHDIANTYAEKQGWTPETLLDLCLDYISHQGSDETFADHLASIAAEENTWPGSNDTPDPDTDSEDWGWAQTPAPTQAPTQAPTRASAQDAAPTQVPIPVPTDETIRTILARTVTGAPVAPADSQAVRTYLSAHLSMGGDFTTDLARVVAENYPLECDEVFGQHER